MKKLLSGLLVCLLLAGVFSFPVTAKATKTGTDKFKGTVGESYKDVYGVYGSDLKNPKVSVKITSGKDCVSKVSASCSKESNGLNLYLKYTCEKPGTVKLVYTFSYEYNGNKYSYDWNAVIDVEDCEGDPPVPTLKITKSPTSETKDEGGSATFIARAENYDDIVWYLTKGKKPSRPPKPLRSSRGSR